MIVFLTALDGGAILVSARMEGDGVVGDLEQTVRQGGAFLGHDYDELKRLGEGEHDITEPDMGNE